MSLKHWRDRCCLACLRAGVSRECDVYCLESTMRSVFTGTVVQREARTLFFFSPKLAFYVAGDWDGWMDGRQLGYAVLLLASMDVQMSLNLFTASRDPKGQGPPPPTPRKVFSTHSVTQDRVPTPSHNHHCPRWMFTWTLLYLFERLRLDFH